MSLQKFHDFWKSVRQNKTSRKSHNNCFIDKSQLSSQAKGDCMIPHDTPTKRNPRSGSLSPSTLFCNRKLLANASFSVNLLVAGQPSNKVSSISFPSYSLKLF